MGKVEKVEKGGKGGSCRIFSGEDAVFTVCTVSLRLIRSPQSLTFKIGVLIYILEYRIYG